MVFPKFSIFFSFLYRIFHFFEFFIKFLMQPNLKAVFPLLRIKQFNVVIRSATAPDIGLPPSGVRGGLFQARMWMLMRAREPPGEN